MNNEQVAEHFRKMERIRSRKSGGLQSDVNGKMILAKNAAIVDGKVLSSKGSYYNQLPQILRADFSVVRGKIDGTHVQIYEGKQQEGYEPLYMSKGDVVYDTLNQMYIPRDLSTEYFVRPFVRVYTLKKGEYARRGLKSELREQFANLLHASSGSSTVYFISAEVAKAMGYKKSREMEYPKRWEMDYGNGGTSDTSISSSDLAHRYHSQRRNYIKGADMERFTCGLEIEKEDSNVLKRIAPTKDQLYANEGWCIETDGSLNSNGGFEAVSGILPLMKTDKIIETLEAARDIINADYSEKCGGHIHVKDRDRDQYELYHDMVGYFPLLYALYPKRALNGFSRAIEHTRMREINGHSVAISMSSRGTVEFRIFPCPSNMTTMVWRVRLCQIMVNNTCTNPQELRAMLMDTKSQLHKHLRLIYKTDAQLQNKFDLVRLFAAQIEKVRIAKMSTKRLNGKVVLEQTRAAKYIKSNRNATKVA